MIRFDTENPTSFDPKKLTIYNPVIETKYGRSFTVCKILYDKAPLQFRFPVKDCTIKKGQFGDNFLTYILDKNNQNEESQQFLSFIQDLEQELVKRMFVLANTIVNMKENNQRNNFCKIPMRTWKELAKMDYPADSNIKKIFSPFLSLNKQADNLPEGASGGDTHNAEQDLVCFLKIAPYTQVFDMEKLNSIQMVEGRKQVLPVVNAPYIRILNNDEKAGKLLKISTFLRTLYVKDIDSKPVDHHVIIGNI